MKIFARGLSSVQFRALGVLQGVSILLLDFSFWKSWSRFYGFPNQIPSSKCGLSRLDFLEGLSR